MTSTQIIDADAYSGFVKSIANTITKRAPRSLNIDDLCQEGFIGLMQAAETFDPSRGISFKTYAAPRIRGAMKDYLRTFADHVSRYQRSKLKARGEEGPKLLSMSELEYVPAHASRDQDVVDNDDLRRFLMMGLNTMERSALTLYYVAGLSMSVVGESLGVHESRVSQLCSNAIKKMRARQRVMDQEASIYLEKA